MKNDWLFKVVPWFIGFVFVVILCWWGFIGVLAFKAADEISTNGLHAVIEKIWCGQKKECAK